jgi:hypothetical protein
MEQGIVSRRNRNNARDLDSPFAHENGSVVQSMLRASVHCGPGHRWQGNLNWPAPPRGPEVLPQAPGSRTARWFLFLPVFILRCVWTHLALTVLNH